MRLKDKVALTAKFNMSDGVRGGLEVDESVEIARLLEKDQTLDALELTGGSSFAHLSSSFVWFHSTGRPRISSRSIVTACSSSATLVGL